jgi:hypothetical protein
VAHLRPGYCLTDPAAVRRAWLQYRDDATARAEANKQSQEALFDLFSRYRGLSEDEKRVVDDLLAEQVNSSEENIRFDALAVIREFRIQSALPALRTLAERLEGGSSPGAPYEWTKVNRLIGLLVEGTNDT